MNKTEDETTDILGTPDNEYLKQLASTSPPPAWWFQGDEEDLFQSKDILVGSKMKTIDWDILQDILQDITQKVGNQSPAKSN